MSDAIDLAASDIVCLSGYAALALLTRNVERLRLLFLPKDWLDLEEQKTDLAAFDDVIHQVKSVCSGSDSTMEGAKSPDPRTAAFVAGEKAAEACGHLISAGNCIAKYAGESVTAVTDSSDQRVFTEAVGRVLDCCSSSIACHLDRPGNRGVSSQAVYLEALSRDWRTLRDAEEAMFPVLGNPVPTHENGPLGQIWPGDACPFAFLSWLKFNDPDEEPIGIGEEYGLPSEADVFGLPNQLIMAYVSRIFMRVAPFFKPPAGSDKELARQCLGAIEEMLRHCHQFCMGEWGTSSSIGENSSMIEEFANALESGTAEELEGSRCVGTVSNCVIEVDHCVGDASYSDEIACNNRSHIVFEAQSAAESVCWMLEVNYESAEKPIAGFAEACSGDLAVLTRLHRSYRPTDFHDYLTGPKVDISEAGPLGLLWPNGFQNASRADGSVA